MVCTIFQLLLRFLSPLFVFAICATSVNMCAWCLCRRLSAPDKQDEISNWTWSCLDRHLIILYFCMEIAVLLAMPLPNNIALTHLQNSCLCVCVILFDIILYTPLLFYVLHFIRTFIHNYHYRCGAMRLINMCDSLSLSISIIYSNMCSTRERIAHTRNNKQRAPKLRRNWL